MRRGRGFFWAVRATRVFNPATRGIARAETRPGNHPSRPRADVGGESPPTARESRALPEDL